MSRVLPFTHPALTSGALYCVPQQICPYVACGSSLAVDMDPLLFLLTRMWQICRHSLNFGLRNRLVLLDPSSPLLPTHASMIHVFSLLTVLISCQRRGCLTYCTESRKVMMIRIVLNWIFDFLHDFYFCFSFLCLLPSLQLLLSSSGLRLSLIHLANDLFLFQMSALYIAFEIREQSARHYRPSPAKNGQKWSKLTLIDDLLVDLSSSTRLVSV